jgi:hypothetical protein
VDRAGRMVSILMIQLTPNRTDIQEKFANGVYQALLN